MRTEGTGGVLSALLAGEVIVSESGVPRIAVSPFGRDGAQYAVRIQFTSLDGQYKLSPLLG